MNPEKLEDNLVVFVAELNAAWLNGKTFHATNTIFRLALTCISCDLPASKKVCGFLSHNAKYGCNKCMKAFDTPVLGKTDYSRYDINNWQMRTGQKHRMDCNKKLLKLESVTRNHNMVADFWHLHYFNPIIDTL